MLNTELEHSQSCDREAAKVYTPGAAFILWICLENKPGCCSNPVTKAANIPFNPSTEEASPASNEQALKTIAGMLQVVLLTAQTLCTELAHSLVQKRNVSQYEHSLLEVININKLIPTSFKKHNAKGKEFLRFYLKQR